MIDNQDAKTKPIKVLNQTILHGEIDVQTSIRERKKNSTNPHKIRFDSSLEFLREKEAKNMADKNLHLYIGEEIPIPQGTPGTGKGKNALKHKVNPV